MPNKTEYRIRCLFWTLNRPFVRFFMKRPFRFSTEKGSDRVPEPPYVCVANHSNFFDPWMVGYQSLRAVFIMMNDDGFRGNRFKAWYLRAIGAFPKKKGAHDFKAMKYTLQLLKSGYPVLIFPEGQTSWDGETQPVYSGIEKIVRRAGCPLVMINLHGNFLSKPWWADYGRKGRIGIKVKVMSAEEISRKTDEEVLSAIKSHIYNNDIKNPANSQVCFKGKNLASGLERFMWACPACRTEDALVTSGNSIACSACRASWNMDFLMRFTPASSSTPEIGDLHDWSCWHKQFVKDKLKMAAPDFVLTVSNDCTMQISSATSSFQDYAKGKIELTLAEIRFSTGSENRVWVLAQIADPVIQLKDIFEFRHGTEYFRFLFYKHSPMKWMYYIRYMRGYEEVEKRGHY